MNDHPSPSDPFESVAAAIREVEDAVERARLDSSARHDLHTGLRKATEALAQLRTAAPEVTDDALADALDAGGTGAWSWDVQTGRVHWSPTLQRMHGLKPGTFEGTFEAYQRDIHPEDRQRVLSTIEETLHRGVDHRLQYRIVRPDGGVRWLETRGRVDRDRDGAVRQVLGVCSDVTERKLAELAAGESASWLATTLASIGDAVIATDPDGRIRFVNAVAAQLVGRPAEEAAGKPLEEVFVVVDEATRKPIENPVFKALRSDAIVGLANHTILIRPDGSEISIDDSAAPIRDPQGRTIGAVLVFRDISDRRQEQLREEFIAQATSLLASFLDYDATIANIVRLAVPHVCDWAAVDLLEDGGEIRRVGVAHVDPEKIALAHELSRRWPPDPDATTGVPAVLRSGRTEWMAEIPPELVEGAARDPTHLEIIRSLGLRSYIVAPMRARGRTLGAVTFVNAESGRSFGDADVRLAEELADVAAIALLNAQLHRRTEIALHTTSVARDRAAELQKITSALAAAIRTEDVAQAAVGIAHDLTGATTTVAYVSRDDAYRLAAHRGLPSSVEQRWSVLPVDAPLPLASALRSGQPQWLGREQLLEDYPHLAQGDVPAEALQAVVALPLCAGEVVRGGLAFSFAAAHAFDQDERDFLVAVARQFGLALERVSLVEELQRTVRFSEMFVGVLGHDLRNPLGGILSSAAVLEAKIQDPAVDRMLSRIRTSAGRMSRMIEQLLDFTRIRLGEGLPIRPNAVDARDICERVVGELQGNDGQDVMLEVNGDTAAHWDGDRVSQLLSNLVGNALQHRESGSRVLVRIEGTEPDAIRIEVSNAGVIPPGLLPRLFEPMAAREEERKSGSPGLGLGLYIAQEIARGHGGRIDARSNDADGTRFAAWLPRRATTGTQRAFTG